MIDTKPFIVNGFEISSRHVGTSSCYHIAKRDNVVYTSTKISYLVRKANKAPKQS